LEIGVEQGDCASSGGGLEVTDVLVAEEELSAEVAALDRVHVGDVDMTGGARTKTNHGPVLEHLAADSTRADEELARVGQFVLESLAKDGDLSVIAGANLKKKRKKKCESAAHSKQKAYRLRVGLGKRLGNGLGGVKEKVLVDRVELATDGLEDLLGNDATNHGRHGLEITRGSERELLDELF